MLDTPKKRYDYSDLCNLPENVVGEILDGELIATPRPSRHHVSAASSLGYLIGPRYQLGEGGGPGGWVILIEPEVGLGSDIVVPDLAGWRRERFLLEEPHNWISVTPDWVSEILSPSTVRIDKIRKMPIYAVHGVSYIWLVDPGNKTLEIYRLESRKWLLLGTYGEDDRVRAEPFPEVEIDLSNLWLV